MYFFTGGRVLITVNIAPTLAMATARATQAARHISFDGKQFRTDIAHKGIARYITFSSCIIKRENNICN